MKCPKCGLDLPDNVRKCPKCGTVNELAPQAAPAKKTKPVVYVIAALLLIIAASGVIALVMAGRARQNVTSAPGGTTPPGNVTAVPPGSPNQGNVVSAPPGNPAPVGVDVLLN